MGRIGDAQKYEMRGQRRGQDREVYITIAQINGNMQTACECTRGYTRRSCRHLIDSGSKNTNNAQNIHK